MTWLTAALLAGYIGICEARVPAPYQACESRWNWALGVLVPSPVPGVGSMVGRLLPIRRRRSAPQPPEEEQL